MEETPGVKSAHQVADLLQQRAPFGRGRFGEQHCGVWSTHFDRDEKSAYGDTKTARLAPGHRNHRRESGVAKREEQVLFTDRPGVGCVSE
jgi:hypothetical protein